MTGESIPHNISVLSTKSTNVNIHVEVSACGTFNEVWRIQNSKTLVQQHRHDLSTTWSYNFIGKTARNDDIQTYSLNIYPTFISAAFDWLQKIRYGPYLIQLIYATYALSTLMPFSMASKLSLQITFDNISKHSPPTKTVGGYDSKWKNPPTDFSPPCN